MAQAIHEKITKQQEFEILRSSLSSERSSFIPHYRDLADYILPRRPQFTVTDSNKGDRRNYKIVDSTATLSARTTRSGMMSGITNPSRPWFRLTTADPDLAEVSAVKIWLNIVTERMNTVFLRSNLYNVLPVIYGDIAVFGTAAMGVEEDLSGEVMRFNAFPVGSYYLANNDKLEVRTFFREFRLTVRQIVEKFEWDNISSHVQNYYNRKQLDAWVEVCHVITTNTDYDPKKIDSKQYTSVYYETGSQGSGANYMSREDKLLRESGYSYFPVLCPRWETTGEDVYGTECPGMIALGDIKALQLMQKRKAQAIEKMVNPPMIAPSFMKNSKVTILPSDVTYVDEREGMKGFRPAHEVNIRLIDLDSTINEHQERISRCFFEDLFLMLANTDRRQITAREIDERHEEKLLALGPVLEQLNQDLLDPLIDITFTIMNNQGLIPEAPPELQGLALKVEYISLMAQAQKLVGVGGVEKFAGFVGSLFAATQNPDILDKVDYDQMVDVYGELSGINPSIVRSDDVVAELRGQRQKAMAAKAKMEAMQNMATMAKDLAGAGAQAANIPAGKEMPISPDMTEQLAGMA